MQLLSSHLSASLGADVVDGVSAEYQAQTDALTTGKSPVTVVESKSPSVQRENVEHAVFPSPLCTRCLACTV